MASQYQRVTGNPANRRTTANAVLQSKIAMLPQAMRNRQAREQIARDAKYQKQAHGMRKKELAHQKDAASKATGLEATKLGFNLATSDLGGKTLGDVGTGLKQGYQKVAGAVGLGGGTGEPGDKADNMVTRMPVGAAISSGLTGYGVGKMMGGKSKTKKALYGGGAGALMGMLAAPTGSSMSGLLAGGLTGGLGGYFS